MNNPESPTAAAIHPRLLRRLEETLARRLRAYEDARQSAWHLVGNVLRLIANLEETLGAPGVAPLRDRCLDILEALDACRTPPLPDPAAIDSVLRRAQELTADAERLLPEMAARRA